MKKILYIALIVFTMLCTVIFGANINVEVTHASSQAVETKAEEYLNTFLSINNADMNAVLQDRRPGTTGEKQAALNIYTMFAINTAFSNFENVEDASTEMGVQPFQFTSYITGLSSVSNNLRFIKKSSISDNKKVIIGASYDNSPYYDEDTKTYTDNVTSSGKVATLLYIADLINGLTSELMFDIEIVFFGAGTNGYAGAYSYMDKMSAKEIDNTLLFINLDQITLGQNLYMYVNEISSHQENYLLDILKSTNIKITDFNSITTLNSNYSGKFNYSHRGLEGNNIAFMEHGITSVNFFTGYFEKIGERAEFEGKTSIIKTKDDNYTYVEENYDFSNLALVANAVINIVTSDSLLYNMTKNKSSSAWLNFWTNPKYPIMFMIIICLLFSLIYIAIYYNNKKKSETIIAEKGVDGLMREINKLDKEIDDESKK